MQKIKGSQTKIKPETVLRPQRCDNFNRFLLHIEIFFPVSKIKRQNQKQRTIKLIRIFFKPSVGKYHTLVYLVECVTRETYRNQGLGKPDRRKVFLTVAHHSGKEVKRSPLMMVKSLKKKHVNWYRERHKEEREKGEVIKEGVG